MIRLADGHTHVFNVGFLPVEGILLSRLPKWLATRHTEILLRLLEVDAPTLTAAEAAGYQRARLALMEMLEAELTAPQALSPFGEEDFFARLARLIPREDVIALAPVLEDTGDTEPLREDTRAVSAMRTRALPDDDVTGARRRFDALLREAHREAGPVETGRPTELSPLAISAGGLIKLLYLLVIHESRIVRSFPKSWNGPPQFDFFVHHMMDMKNHYTGRPPHYDFASEQHDRMVAVAKLSSVPLHGFTAFDPFRPDAERLAIVDAARNRGFRGVKFYPPNGYRPLDNMDGDIVNGPSAAAVNKRNLEFFEYCVNYDFPVFTHCTSSGFESRPGVTGPFSNPIHWRHVLETAGLDKLRLCFGHAGGQDGWLAPPTPEGNTRWFNSYAHQVVELCSEYDNVYCDFGYFDELLTGEDWLFFQRRLEDAVTTHPIFAAKCCYGTDWHLITAQGHARDYPERWFAIVRDKPWQETTMRFNCARFLKL